MGKDKDIRDSSMRNQGDLSEMSVDANNDGDGVQVRRLRPDSPVSGSLRLTRSDIDGSLACAEKNLATFRKQVRLSNGSFVFLIHARLLFARMSKLINLLINQTQVTFADCGIAYADRIDAGAAGITVDISVQRMTGSEFFLTADLTGWVTILAAGMHN